MVVNEFGTADILYIDSLKREERNLDRLGRAQESTMRTHVSLGLGGCPSPRSIIL
jgi:hypothetical protein